MTAMTLARAVRSGLVTLAVLLAIVRPGAAQQAVAFPEAGDAVPGATGVTYLDLIREIVPDMAARPDGGFAGTRAVEVRHIAGPDSDAQSPVTTTLDTGISAVPLGDGKRMMLLFELGSPEGDVAKFTVLALYDLEAKAPRLLDAANVGFSESNFFLTPVILPLGGGDLVLTLSLHFNSSQAYQTTVLTMLRDDRLVHVDDIFTFDDKFCAFERAQLVAFDIVPSATPFANIEASVTETTTPTGQPCGDEKVPEAGERTIAVTYEWDAAAGRYVPDSDAFERLAKENEERF